METWHLTEPLPADLRVDDALDAYLAENGFAREGYDAKWTGASFFGLPIAVPNTRHHRWAIMRHDILHVLTGYGTDHAGEAEISAIEVKLALRDLGPYVGGIVLAGYTLGLSTHRRRTRAAYAAAGNLRSLYEGSAPTYEAMLAMRVGELRAWARIPERGLTTSPRALHLRAPKGAVLGSEPHAVASCSRI
ncbi:hypothetical protein BH09MYX1_BH09MYX1_65540 [soil metagenome]